MVRPGDRVSDRYQVIEQLAEGGMGTLWRARHLELEVDVALKVISGGGATPSSLKRFKREAQAAARLRSPNIVQVLDFGVFEGEPYLAMELLKGEDLASLLAREGRLPVERCHKIIRGVAKAVQLAHEADIVHRDLKPANIFLEQVADDQVVKILDFGVAKDLRAQADPSGTTSAGAVGSPAYMSPEQVWAEKVGPRADIWALGVVTFEMLTGENPFVDDTLAKVFERIIRAPLPKVSDFSPELPASLDTFFARALARNVDERIPTAKAFAEQLRASIEDPTAQQANTASVSSKAPPRTTSPFATTQGRPAASRRAGRQRIALGLIAAFVVTGALAFALLKPGAVTPELASVNSGVRVAPAAALTSSNPSPAPLPAATGAEKASAPPGVPTPPAAQPTRATGRPKAPSQSGLGSKPSATKPQTQPALDPKFGIPLPE